MNQPTGLPATTARPIPLRALMLLIGGTFTCAIYANLSFAVRNSADYRFFPPFLRHVNENNNHHLGGESFNMARSLVAGQGFASPFNYPSGSTAWHPPVLPAILAGLLWLVGDSRDSVMAVIVFVQVLVFIGTGLLIVALVRQTTGRIGPSLTAVLFLAWLLCYFHSSFQENQDNWIVLLSLDLLILGLCWLQPLWHWHSAVAWGLFGGLCALINPIVGFAWGILTCLIGAGQRAWPRLALAVLVAGLILTPWTVRNYQVFGRWIPVKSNLAYELYQSQCMQPNGLLQNTTFSLHPYGPSTQEGHEYMVLGERAYLERKERQFRQAVAADPLDFLQRIGSRFLGATLWYVPFVRAQELDRPWMIWMSRLIHPLPFLALLFLIFSDIWERLRWEQWLVIGVYLLYLLPYIVISYYDRYAVPLLGLKLLLVIWAVDRLISTARKRRMGGDSAGFVLDSARAENTAGGPVGRPGHNSGAPVHCLGR